MTMAITTTTAAQVAKVENFGGNLIERFVKFAGVSESSRMTYAKCLRQLFSYFNANAIARPTRDNLVDWLDDMKAAKKSASTIQLYLTATKIFFRWLNQESLYPNIADNLKSGVKPSHSHKKDALSTEQCAELIQGVKAISKVKKLHNEEKELRDKAILSLMCTAGLRTIEVVRANVNDIRFERGKCFLYVQGKGHSDADEKILLAKQTQKALQAYLKVRKPAAASEPLFVSTSRSNKGKRLDTQTIRKMVKARLREMGLDTPRLTAHSLRHSVCSNLVFAGVELPKIQMIARHKNLNTTMTYQHFFERYNNDGEQLLADLIFSQMKE